MAKGSSSSQQQLQNLGADVIQLIDQLERYCLAPDGSLVSKSAHSDLQLAREEMERERTRYLEAMAIYAEVVAMVEEYQQTMSGTSVGSARDLQGIGSQPGLMSSHQVYAALEHRLVVAEAAQRLRLPLLSKDGDIHEEEIEKWSGMSRTSFDSSSSSLTMNSSNSVVYGNNTMGNTGISPSIAPSSSSGIAEPGVGGVPNQFLGITPNFLWQVQKEKQALTAVDVTEYQRSLACEVETRLDVKCDKLADAFAIDEIDSSSISQITSSRLPERVKLLIEEIEREEEILLEDLYSMDRKFAEHYNVLEQILILLIKFVKELKLQHQHQYDDLRKTWLCKRCQTMNAKLRVLEHLLLRDTYTKDSVPALHRIRNYLLDATEDASSGYNKAVTRLREYQGVDPHFDSIARQYHDIVKKLEGMQWTIHQVEMDLKRSLEHPSS